MKSSILVAAIIASSAVAGTVVTATSATGTVRPCAPESLSLVFDPTGTSEATGQHSVVLNLVNTSASSCQLHGYPTIAMLSGSRALPFVISHRGDQMVTGAQPRTVVVSPKHRAYIVVNKYRCDAGDRAGATSVSVRLGRGSQLLTIRFASISRRWISYCGPGDPGSTLTVSPYAATLGGALAKH